MNPMTDRQALVIDDNALNNEILATLLEHEGIEAIYITSPRHLDTALANLSNLKVIFLDLEIPNYNGFEIHQKLRDDGRFDRIPIVAYTVHTNEIDQVRRAGFDGFLGKPINPDQFPNHLARIIRGEAVWEV
jgi:two-component system cell cycle response regulator DivK